MSFVDIHPEEQTSTLVTDPDWWRGAVIYQIYPRSFQDSNGDGIGDLQGIIERLPHVASLNVDAVWISPFFTSPMLDYGYDVSDYCDVDPMFGSIGDFDRLIERAHELGIRVIIDLVLSHTSDQHKWFVESRFSRDNAKANWYVWADAKPDGTPPNNWLSIFGGSAWEWDTSRMQYYLHNFLREQPDLNFHEPAVQEALLAVARFWLERGVDGFRLDTVNFYVHDKELRDNPALPDERKSDAIAPAVNPYTWQEHLYSKSQPENIAFLKKLRALMDEFRDITSVGEVGDDQQGLQIQAEYTQGTDRLHLCYGFDFLSAPYPSGTRVAEVLNRFDELAEDSWACWAYSNHDVVRHTTRWSLTEASQKAYLALLLSLRGSVCLYQGEELGLPEADVAFEDLHDPYGIKFWPKFRGRDGCRTPMVWASNAENGGFSTAKPWLPVSDKHAARSADVQEADPASMLNFYRQMIAYRKSRPVLCKGTLEIVTAEDAFFAVTRHMGDERMFVAFNLSDVSQGVDLPEGDWQVDGDAPFEVVQSGDELILPPWQVLFAHEGG
ncbi:MAG: alpha-amylase family glycosyl hydrolase [Paracoccaceae bacterium]|nr:alpha-amylase family glycosyl hydrolase [Paracoccaceae bacterium]